MRETAGRAAAVVLAGGSGTRVGTGRNKVYLPLAGRPVIAWSLAVFASMPAIGPVVLVARAQDRAAAEEVAGPAEIVTGGATRQESELAGLRLLAGRIGSGEIDVVLVHDGARPLLTAVLVTRVLDAARATGGAVPGLPRTDLAVAGPDGTGLAGPAPEGLVAMQTPQGFRAGTLLAAYERADAEGFAGTDTASCVQRFAPGTQVRCVAGDDRNFKITYPHDLMVAERLLAGAARGDDLVPRIT